MEMEGPRVVLGVALSGMEPLGGLRAQVERARSMGFGAVQLNAAAADARPRDLSRSARRDIGSVLRRSGLLCAGVDLWIPAEHFADAARADRAVSATMDAIEFAREMADLCGGRAVVCATLTQEASAPGVARALGEAARSMRVQLADFSRKGGEADKGASMGAAAGADDGVGLGLDAGAVVRAGGDPAAELGRLGSRVVAARLTDDDGVSRVAPGSGRLDLLGYLVGLSMREDLWPIVFDGRGVVRAEEAARLAVDRCGQRAG